MDWHWRAEEPWALVTKPAVKFGTTFNGTTAAPTNWTSTSITVSVPSGATTGNVVVTTGGIPSAGVSFSVIPPETLNTSRYQHSATVLNSGQVLIAGGVACPAANNCSYLNSTELYDPVSGNSFVTGSLATARVAPAIFLANGQPFFESFARQRLA